MLRSLLAVSFWLAVLAAPPALAQSLIVNGSFEDADAGINPGATFRRLPNGDTRVTGWITSGPTIDYIGTFWVASDGLRSFDLDGAPGNTAALLQTFATTPGTLYLVTFDMAGNPDNLPAIKPMRVSADGQSADFTFDVTGRDHDNMGWSPRSWSFVADDTSATLEFRSLTTPETLQGWGPAIDNVVVQIAPPVPALGGPALVTLGALLLLCIFQGSRRGRAREHRSCYRREVGHVQCAQVAAKLGRDTGTRSG